MLTHDVESAKGVERCLELAKLEERLGFRSSFNFVAEDYITPSELVDNLRSRGFEIGLHGLRHDGNLFKSKKFFRKKVDRINRYLKEWGASGFRSPSMYCNLEWIGDLNIEYDSSTFDTDPFEPQPDGVGTIFPFWVSNNRVGRGYVELPYTLPQDFLLFVILREKGVDTWKRKLDWIAPKGGMVLVNVHPDYISFDAEKKDRGEYPAKYYKNLLEYIQEKYNDQYWNALPKDIARVWSVNFKDDDRRITSKIRVCMLAYSFYESDNRVMRYAETLARRGDEVDVISLRRNGQEKEEILRGVNILRIQERPINEKKKLAYISRILRFFFKSLIILSRRHLKRRYDLVHVHNVPDFLVFAALIPKLLGAKIILDIHDILPEFYSSKFNNNKQNGIGLTGLKMVEKASANFSNHVIISNHIWAKKLISRSVCEDKLSIFINYPDEKIFYTRHKHNRSKRFVMIYPGTLNWHQGLDIAIKALAIIRDEVPQLEFHIYGDGSEKSNLEDLVQELVLQEKVIFKNGMPLDKIAAIMAEADLGIVPKRDGFFGGEAFSTKILEFMALGVPVIVSKTKIDRYYFNESVIKYFKPEDEKDLASCILDLVRDDSERALLSENALKFVRDFTWGKKEAQYVNLVDTLVRNHSL